MDFCCLGVFCCSGVFCLGFFCCSDVLLFGCICYVFLTNWPFFSAPATLVLWVGLIIIALVVTWNKRDDKTVMSLYDAPPTHPLIFISAI